MRLVFQPRTHSLGQAETQHSNSKAQTWSLLGSPYGQRDFEGFQLLKELQQNHHTTHCPKQGFHNRCPFSVTNLFAQLQGNGTDSHLETYVCFLSYWHLRCSLNTGDLLHLYLSAALHLKFNNGLKLFCSSILFKSIGHTCTTKYLSVGYHLTWNININMNINLNKILWHNCIGTNMFLSLRKA